MARPTKIGLAVRVKETVKGVVTYPRYEVTFKSGRPYRCRRTTDGAEIAIPADGSFYLTHPKNANGERVTPLGSGLDQAFLQYQRFADNAERQKRGLAVLKDFVSHATEGENRVPIASAIEKYLLEIETAGRSKATHAAYRKPLKDFERSCGKTFIDELKREDLLDYLTWMRKNLQRRSVGQQTITFVKRLGYVSTFLAKNGKAQLWPKKEWPKYVKTKPTKYDTETLDAILKAATPEESIRLRFFIYTGCRDMEVAHAEYSDVDAKTGIFHVKNKPHMNWKPKDSEERDVMLPKAFVKELIQRRGTAKDGLIFPNRMKKIDNNLIEFLQKAAKRAGITDRVTLHKIRRTTGSLYAKKFGINNAQKILGHSDIQTTARYMVADDMTSAKHRTEVEDMFTELVS